MSLAVRSICLVLLASLAFNCPGQKYHADNIVIIKGESDPANYRYKMLDNGLKLLLISDDQLIKAYGSLSVRAGYFQDPVEIPGLAHLYEHMLSKGSKKYPLAAEYKQFLSDNGGKSNASTSGRRTNYYFQVAQSGFEPALDRFTWQFVDPLIPAEVVYKERHAVNAEFRVKFSDPSRRKRETLRTLFNPEHPYHKFSTGNLDTLQDTPEQLLSDAIVEFGQSYYCAPEMAVVLAAPLSLDKLEALGKTAFAGVPTDCQKVVSESPTAFIEPPDGKVLNIKTIKKRSRLTMSFVVPDSLASRNSLVAEYMNWLFETYNPDGLKQYLQDHGFIQEINASVREIDEQHDLFELEYKLHDKGFSDTSAIVAATFDYIDLMLQQAASQNQFESFSKLRKVNFNQDSRHKTANDIRHLASNLLFEPPARVLAAGKISENFSATDIQQWLAHLTPENLLLTRENRQFATSETEPVYGTAFTIDGELEWNENSPPVLFKLPALSPYFAKTQTISRPDAIQPQALLDNQELTTWYLPTMVEDDTYTAIHVYLDTHSNKTDKAFKFLNPLMVRRLEMQLEVVLESARQANIKAAIRPTPYGLELQVSGRGGNWQKLMEDLIRGLKDPQLNVGQRVDSLKRHEHALNGRLRDRLSQQTTTLLNSKFGLTATTDESLAYFEDFQEKDYGSFTKGYMNKAHLSGFYYGYLDKATVEDLNRQLQAWGKEIQNPMRASIEQLPNTSIDITTARMNSQDSAIRLVLFPPDQSLESVANTAIAGSMMKAPFFNQLRTREQLGYSVSAGTKRLQGQAMIGYFVQSPVSTSGQLVERVATFNQWYLNWLNDMTTERFERAKENVITTMQQTLINSESAESQMRRTLRQGREVNYHKQLRSTVESMQQSKFLKSSKVLLDQPLQGVITDRVL